MSTETRAWQALLEGRDRITDLPDGRWSEFLEKPRLAAPAGRRGPHPGRLPEGHQGGFDSEFFAVARPKPSNIDPQQRMALELTWEALEHARIPAFCEQAVGVYIGSSPTAHGLTIVGAGWSRTTACDRGTRQ